MKRACRSLQVALMAAAVVLGACKDEVRQGEPLVAYWVPEPVAPSLTVGAGLDETRNKLYALHKLRPDARFMNAFARVSEVLTGSPGTNATADYADGNWVIKHDGKELGTVSSYPDFDELFELLLAHARKEAADNPLEAGDRFEGPVPSLYPVESALAFLRKLQAAWEKERSSNHFLPAAEALAALVVQTRDPLEVADDLYAHALATTALATIYDDKRALRARCLLAAAMQYSRAAARLSLKLPDGDPIAAYLLRDDHLLAKLADGPEASAEARYLRLLRVVFLNDHKMEADLKTRYFPAGQKSLSILTLKFGLEQFRIAEMEEELLPWLVLDHLLGKGVDLAADKVSVETGADAEFYLLIKTISVARKVGPDDIVRAVDSALARMEAPGRAGVFDVKMETAFYRALAYTGFFRKAKFFTRDLNSEKSADRYAQVLDGMESSLGREVRQWFELWNAASFGRMKPKEIAAAQGKLERISAAGHYWLWERLQPRAEWGDSLLVTMARTLSRRMDSRVEHRFNLVQIAWTTLYDMVLLEKILTSLCETAPGRYPRWDVWHARMAGNVDALKSMMEDTGLPVKTRVTVLAALRRVGSVEHAQVTGYFEALIAEQPSEWKLSEEYIDYLEGEEEYEAARDVARRWLAKYRSSPGLGAVTAQTKIARMYYNEGRFEEGMNAVEPARAGMWAGTLKRRGLLLSALGRYDEAIEQAHEWLDRYPTTVGAVALLAEVYWKMGRYSDGARTLARPPAQLRLQDWTERLGPAFMRAFGKGRDAAAMEAVSELLKSQVVIDGLIALSASASQEGRHKLAFDILNSLKASGIRVDDISRRGYQELKEAKGEEAALAWLGTRVQRDLMGRFAIMAYDGGEDELLFSFVPDPEGRDDVADYIWVQRAAAATRNPELAERHMKSLKAHYAQKGYSYYHQIGRFLVGEVGLSEMLALAGSPDVATEVAYYAGLKAEIEGRLSDASDWYRIVMELGQTREGENRWAREQLYRWRNAGRYLSNSHGDN